MILLSVVSVFVGWITAVALVVIARSLVEYPLLEISALEVGAPVPGAYLWARVGYATLAAGCGGFVTAWLAPRAPLRHALVLALLLAAPAVLYAQPEWATERALHDPAVIVLPPIGVLVGSWLRGRIGRRVPEK